MTEMKPNAITARFDRVEYDALNAREKEAFNLARLGAALAAYGFTLHPLLNDWNGADALASHRDGEVLRIQLKSRATLAKKYLDKGLHVAFPHDGAWLIYDHDAIVEEAMPRLEGTASWVEHGAYSWGSPPAWLLTLLAPYRVS